MTKQALVTPVLIPIDGTLASIELPSRAKTGELLKALQSRVGGYVQTVAIDPRALESLGYQMAIEKPEELILIVDEEGLIKNRPFNSFASVLANQILVGDAVLVRVGTDID